MLFGSLDPLAAASLALAVIALLLIGLFLWRQAVLLRRYRALLHTPAGTDLEELLLTHAQELGQLGDRLAALEARTEQMLAADVRHVQRLGIVRFSAFPDVGSDLSYAVAVLDGANNGVVFSSLYTRNECRVYAKPIQNGTSTYTLTDEEKEALARAMPARKG